MSFIHKIKIKTKLLVLMSLMVAGILVVGATGYLSAKRTQDALTIVYRDNLLVIEALSDARTQSRANYANILRLVAISDASYQKNVLEDLEKRNKTLDEDIKKIKNMTLDAYERESISKLGENLEAWHKTQDAAIELVTSGKSADALKLFKSSGETVFEEVQSILRNMESYNIKEADTVYNKNKSDSEKTILYLAIIIGIISAICIFMGVVIISAVSKPISKVVGLIKKTADFDLVYDVSFDSLLKHEDEIGIIVKSVSNMRAALNATVSKLMNYSASLADSSAELNAATDESTKTINQVAVAINEIAKGNSNQADSINRACETIADVADNITEVNQVTIQSANSAKESLTMVSEGQGAVDLSNGKMKENIAVANEVNGSLNELSESISKVGEISDVINSIAAQTNLLALNAAIEAARAGEAGRGFAVVAEEIRKLAEESSSAANKINNIIKDTVSKNEITLENMHKAKEIVKEQSIALNAIEEVFARIKLSVGGIAECTEKASEMLKNVDSEAKEISDMAHDMAAVAEQAAAGSEEISASGEEQLASTELIAQSAGDLAAMAADMNRELSLFKL